MKIQRQKENKRMEIENDHKVIDKIVINLIHINNYSKYECIGLTLKRNTMIEYIIICYLKETHFRFKDTH